MAFRSFEDLEVWKRGCALAVFVYKTLKEVRDFGLRDQMQRSTVSIPSNIAEGYERTDKEFMRFLSIARGSAAELCTQAYIARKVGLITPEASKHIVEETGQLRRMMQALANSRRAKT